MTKSTKAKKRIAFTRDSYDIPDSTHLPIDWVATEIVLARLTYDIDHRGRLNFRFSDVSYYKVKPTWGLQGFLTDLEANRLPRGDRGITAVPPVSPLEIPVANRGHVVVTFESGLPARFRTTGPAITQKEDYGDHNCGLVRYSDTTAYFAIAWRGKGFHEHFNFHIELEQDGNRGWLGITLDPDVPDDGGGVPPMVPPSPSKKKGGKKLKKLQKDRA